MSSAIIDSCESSRSWTRDHRARSRRQTAIDRHPPNARPRRRSAAPIAAQLTGETALDQGALRRSRFGRSLLRGNEEIARKLDGGLHMASQDTVSLWSTPPVATSAMPAGLLYRQGRGGRPQDGKRRRGGVRSQRADRERGICSRPKVGVTQGDAPTWPRARHGTGVRPEGRGPGQVLRSARAGPRRNRGDRRGHGSGRRHHRPRRAAPARQIGRFFAACRSGWG